MKRFLFLLFLLPVLMSGCVTGVSNEETAVVYYNLGNAYLELEQWDKAVSAFLNAVSLDNTLFRANYNLARTYISSGNIQKGIEVLEALLPEDEENSVILETLAWAYHLSGENSRALSVYEKILFRTEVNQNALYNGGMILWSQEKIDEAYDYLTRLYRISPDDPELLFNLGLLEIETKKSDGLEYFIACRDLDPQRKDNLAALGEAFYNDKSYVSALEVYDEYLDMDNSDGRILFEKAFILLTAIEDLEAGLTALSDAVSAGFEDTERFNALAGYPDLLYGEEIRKYLNDGGLLNDQEEISTDDDDGSVDEPVSDPPSPDE